MDYDKLGRRLREERHKLNMTQETLAEKVDISDAYIGQIERGERHLTLDTLVRLTNQLGVTIDYVLQDSIEYDDVHFIDQIKQIAYQRSSKEKQMALDMLKMMFSHVDNLTK